MKKATPRSGKGENRLLPAMLLALAVAAATIVGCGKEKTTQEQPVASTVAPDLSAAAVAGVAFTPCHGDIALPMAAKSHWPLDSIAVSVQDGIITVSHRNIDYFCGVDSVLTAVHPRGDTLVVVETLHFPMDAQSNCRCHYSNRFDITGIPTSGEAKAMQPSTRLVLEFLLVHKEFPFASPITIDTSLVGHKTIEL